MHASPNTGANGTSLFSPGKIAKPDRPAIDHSDHEVRRHTTAPALLPAHAATRSPRSPATPRQSRSSERTRPGTRLVPAVSHSATPSAHRAPPSPRPGPVFFWRETETPYGCLAQWSPHGFEIGGARYANAEAWMMASKARLFGDETAARKIVASSDPRTAKALGRKVRGFDAVQWERCARDIVMEGNMAKFSQNQMLRSVLLSTGERVLVEASPFDKIWGIGMAADDPRAMNRSEWCGTNWLGETLMSVRAELRATYG